MTKQSFDVGEYAERIPWELEIPYWGSTNDGVESLCPHAIVLGDPIPQYRTDGSMWGRKLNYQLPAGMIQCENEAGCNHTLLCIACLDEARNAHEPRGRRLVDELDPRPAVKS